MGKACPSAVVRPTPGMGDCPLGSGLRVESVYQGPALESPSALRPHLGVSFLPSPTSCFPSLLWSAHALCSQGRPGLSGGLQGRRSHLGPWNPILLSRGRGWRCLTWFSCAGGTTGAARGLGFPQRKRCSRGPASSWLGSLWPCGHLDDG